MGIIKLPKSSVKFFEENYQDIFETGSLAEGKWNNSCADLVKELTEIKYSITVSSNGTGMAALIQMVEREYGKKRVFIQSNTMYGVKTMVKASGASYEGEINCDSILLVPTLEMVKDSVSDISDKKNLLIILSHIGGIINPWIEDISEFCEEEGIVLLEDCAHSYGSTLNGKHSGSFGAGGVYSFYSTKAIPSGEGGMIVTNDKILGELCSKYVMYDRFDRELEIANNIRQSEIQALLLYSVLNCTNEIIEDKRKTASNYIKICNEKKIEYLDQEGSNKGNYYKFILSSNDKNVQNLYKSINNSTSQVYDYALGASLEIVNSHVCLPIWYKQEDNLTNSVVKELEQLF